MSVQEKAERGAAVCVFCSSESDPSRSISAIQRCRRALMQGRFTPNRRIDEGHGDGGWRAELCLVQPDESAAAAVQRALAGQAFDCVVIGAGIRIPPKHLLLFEALINAVHKAAPNAAIAFNSSPESTAEAAARWAKRA